MPSIDRLPSSPAVADSRVLTSDWTGLSPHLIAKFFRVRKVEGARWERDPDSPEVWAPISAGNIEQAQNWTSPFENAGMDSRLSSFSSLLQTGGFDSIVNALQEYTRKDSATNALLGGVRQELSQLTGRSGVTKLNSTQVYTGSPPLKLTLTAHFRALFDATKEVTEPAQQLIGWGTPERLAPEGTLANVAQGGLGIRTVYASLAPPIIAMLYADCIFRPMVIESISRPLTTPRDSKGRSISQDLQMTIASLTALDRADFLAIGGL